MHIPRVSRLSASPQKVLLVALEFLFLFLRRLICSRLNRTQPSPRWTLSEKVSGYRRQSAWKFGTARWSVASWPANPLRPHVRTGSEATTRAPVGRQLSPLMMCGHLSDSCLLARLSR